MLKDPIDPTGAVDFYSGLVVGLFGLGPADIPNLEGCIKASSTITVDVQDIITEIDKGDINSIMKGVMDSWDLIKAAPTELKSCIFISDDQEKELEAWGSIFLDPVQAMKTITANLIKNYVGAIGDAVSFATKIYNS